jgi:hypothetical protein
MLAPIAVTNIGGMAIPPGPVKRTTSAEVKVGRFRSRSAQIEQLKAKLARKNEVMAELMEALTLEKKSNRSLP